ncbi:MAG: four-helix bundle copper-binding protein [Pseudomonadota bacterium]
MKNTPISELPQDNNRRNLLLGAAAMTATLVAGQTLAATGHKHHQMNKHTAVIDAAMDCIKKGDACLDHCIELVKMGDTSIAECLATVTDMLPTCNALSKLAANQSPYLAELANVCISVCEACEKECRKHADKHTECKNCAESCAACIKECKKIAA